MTTIKKKLLQRATCLLPVLLAIVNAAFARVGGAGGHGGGGGGFGGGGGGFGGGGGIGFVNSPVAIIIIVIIVIAYNYYQKQQRNNEAEPLPPVESRASFPEGLDQNKVAGSFMAIQDAWQKRDLKNVRKWLSDGMYQRLTTQYKMMDILAQKNILSNIRINGIAAAATSIDGSYETAEIAISFTMDDNFMSTKYPQFNESYAGDSDTEYWTFIKRKDSPGEKNLYDNNNCPNCGAPFEVKMGEISRCSNCNTLTNSAAYDWVLSEITQAADYSGGAGMQNEPMLKDLMKNDPFFAVQRMEDIASNIFMQIMDVIVETDKKRLTRFAEEAVAAKIITLKQNMQPFVFDRLYLNNVTLAGYNTDGPVVNLFFEVNATYRRVAVGNKLQMIDEDFVTSPFKMQLSRNKDVPANGKTGETVYSYECSSCGAPYTDTTENECTYCGAPVIDKQRNWVLTNFGWG